MPKEHRQRSEGIQVRVSKEEKDELQTAADQAGMSLSVFVRVVSLEAARLRSLEQEQRRRRAQALSDLAANDRDQL